MIFPLRVTFRGAPSAFLCAAMPPNSVVGGLWARSATPDPDSWCPVFLVLTLGTWITNTVTEKGGARVSGLYAMPALGVKAAAACHAVARTSSRHRCPSTDTVTTTRHRY